MTETEVTRSMVLSFRLLELQSLLTFAGKSKLGKKSELQNRALELLPNGDKEIFDKICDLSNAMHKQLGSSPSINPYNQSQNNAHNDHGHEKSSGISNTNTETRAQSSKRTQISNTRLPTIAKKNNDKSKTLARTKSPTKNQKEKTLEPNDIGDSRRPRRAAAIAASAAMMGHKVHDKQLSSANVASSDESTTEDECEGDEESEDRFANATHESEDDPSAVEDDEEFSLSEMDSPAKKKGQTNKDKKKQNTKKGTTSKSKQSNASKETARSWKELKESKKADLNNGNTSRDKTTNSTNQSRNMNNAVNSPYASTLGKSMAVPSASNNSGNPSVYGYGGLPIAPPLNGNSTGFLPSSSHIPPAQRAGPYIPYFPQASKPSNRTPLQRNPKQKTQDISKFFIKRHLVYPTFADVKLRKLPFYEVMASLLKPSSLQPQGNARFQEQTFSFHLTPQQVSAIEQSGYRDTVGRPDYKKQIQVRFSLLETSCEQMDNFPSSICVKVNGRLQPLPNPIPTNKPGVEPKRPPKAINVTGLCKLSSTVPNYINVSWTVEVGRGNTISVYFVEKLSSQDLLQKLKSKGQRHPDYTRAVIKDKLNDTDNEIATTSCKVSLACPLGKQRMKIPCRSSSCDHLQCFDANSYLQMNEMNDKWVCPVCNKPAPFDTLMLDGFFSELVTSKRLPRDEHELVLHNDASWDPLSPPKTQHIETETPKPILPRKKIETLDLDLDCSFTGKTKREKSKRNIQNNLPENFNRHEESPCSVISSECIVLDSTTETFQNNEEVRSSRRKKRKAKNAYENDTDDSSIIVIDC